MYLALHMYYMYSLCVTFNSIRSLQVMMALELQIIFIFDYFLLFCKRICT